MKKAKIMLAIVGLFSVIAGAFAFKAQHKFSGAYKCLTANGITTFATRYATTAKGLAAGATLTCTLVGSGFPGTTRYVTQNI